MFEAVATVCMLSAPERCETRLLPVDARDEATCLDAAAAFAQPDLKLLSVICAAVPEAQEFFTEIATGVWAHKGIVADVSPENAGDISNIGLVVGDTSVAVIDSGGSRSVGGKAYLAIRAITPLPVSHLVLTHVHPDHIFGAAVFAEAGAEIIGHPNLAPALSEREGNYRQSFSRLMGKGFGLTTAPVPTVAAETGTRIDLGGRTLRLDAWKLAHTSTDLTVLDEITGTLFTGDLVFHEHVPALDGSLLGWEETLSSLNELDPKRIVPGHGGPVLPWPEGAAPLVAYLEGLKTKVREAIDAGDTLADTVARLEEEKAADGWQLVPLFHARNATVAFTELEWE